MSLHARIREWGHGLDATALPVPLIAVALVCATYVLLGASPDPRAVLLAASGAFLVYLGDRAWMQWEEDRINRPERQLWHRRRPWDRWILTMAALTAALWAAWGLPKEILWLSVPLVLAAVWHMMPIPGFRVKKRPYLKPALVAGAWASGAVLLPVLSLTPELRTEDWGWFAAGIGAMRFAAVGANVLISDLHDQVGDSQSGLTSTATTLGVGGSRRAAVALLACGASIALGLNLWTGSGLWLVEAAGSVVYAGTLLPGGRGLPSPLVLDLLVGWPALTVAAAAAGMR